MKSAQLALTLALPAFALGCGALDSVTATTVVAGTIVKTPELRVMGQFDVGSEIIASAWVGERKNATDTGEPSPIKGADVNLTFAGNRIALAEQTDTEGLYLINTVDTPNSGLMYAGGTTYTVRADINNGTVAEYGGTVSAPTALTPAALVLSPQPSMTVPGFDNVFVHAKSTAINVAWAGEQFGRYPYVSVLRAKANDPENPELVFDNRPEGAQETIEFILGTPPTSVDIPADTFAADGLYGIVVVIMNKHDSLLPNTFIGSPILAGSGAAIVLSVGTP